MIFQVFDEVVPRDGDDRAEERDPGARHHHRRRHGHEHPPQGRQNDHQEQRPGQLGDDQYSRQQHPVIILKLRIMNGLTADSTWRHEESPNEKSPKSHKHQK